MRPFSQQTPHRKNTGVPNNINNGSVLSFCYSPMMRGGDMVVEAGSTAKPCYLYGDDVAGAVNHRQALVHEQLPHVFDVPLVSPAERLPLGALQDPDRLQGSRQDHWRQGSGKDEAGCEGAHRVHQGGAAGDVAPNTAKGFAWNSHRQKVCAVS